MALQYATTVEATGAAVSEAYAKITSFSYSQGLGEVLRFSVDVFFDVAARAAIKTPVASFAFEVTDFDFTEQKAIKTALYEFLKTQEQFASAIDV
jgi:hypothetical protein